MLRGFHRIHEISRWLLCAALACAVASCGAQSDTGANDPGRTADSRSPAADRTAPARAPSAAARPRIVALGDSITAGLGLPLEESYPALLQQRLDERGLDYQVVNAGVSGDTTAGGLRRVDWALDGDVRVLIVALGGNDALRGLPVDQLQQNLSTIVERAQGRNIKVILAGMEAPPNFGPAYTAAFHRAYPDLAKKYGVALVPFLLEGVAGISELNQRDGIHPTAEGARKVADNIWRALEPLLKHD
jgi:acyl-CoA thioesterase I